MVDFSDDLKRQLDQIYLRRPNDFDSRMTPLLVDLTKTPGQRKVMIGRAFTHKVRKRGMDVSYNDAIKAIGVRVRSGDFGRQVYVFVPKEYQRDAVRHIEGLRGKLGSYFPKS